MPIDLGTEATVTWTPTGGAGHTVTLTVTDPLGDTTSPSVSETTGTFSATVGTSIAGRHLLAWEDTTATVLHTDTIEVWPADPRFLISFADAAAALQWRPSDIATHGETLRLYIAAATPIIEDIVGSVLISTCVDYRDGGKIGVTLSKRPSAVTSVEVDGQLITGYVVNENARIVYRGKYNERFDDGRQVVKVTYTTGSAEVPPNIQLGTRELVRHLWQIGQQVTTGTVAEYGDRPMGLTPSGFAVPKRVIELCAASAYRVPGIA